MNNAERGYADFLQGVWLSQSSYSSATPEAKLEWLIGWDQSRIDWYKQFEKDPLNDKGF